MAVFEKRLRQLGFNPIDKEISIAVRSSGASRNERRRFKKQRYRPWFSATDLITYATDENGQTWCGPPNTNLSFLGFEDKSHEVVAELQTLKKGKSRFH